MDSSGLSSAPFIVSASFGGTELQAAQALAPPAATGTAPMVVACAAPATTQPPKMAEVKVTTQTGAEAGQQIKFVPPGHGQAMSVTCPQRLAPGALLTVQYPVSSTAASSHAPPALVSTPQPQLPIMTEVKVSVQRGAEPGQQITFVPPGHGQTMSVTSPQRLAPGALLSVQCPVPSTNASSHAPPAQQTEIDLGDGALRLPRAEAHLDADSRGMKIGWSMYLCGCLLCFFHPVIGLCLWTAGTCLFYCKPSADRARLPRSRTAGRVTAASLAAACFLVLACVVIAGTMGHHGSHGGHPGHHSHSHHRHHGHHHGHGFLEMEYPMGAVTHTHMAMTLDDISSSDQNEVMA